MDIQNEIEKLVNQYSLIQLSYNKFKEYMLNEIENMLIENGIRFQNLSGRVKDINSLRGKLKNEQLLEKLNGDIKNLNDLCGIRIILYDDTNYRKTLQLIEENYKIIYFKNKSVAYNANNIVVEKEKGTFSNYKCEIQLVTLMFHNLIEIEHNIFYKDSKMLEEKDKEEYDSIKEEYQKCLEEVYKLEYRIEEIQTRAENIAKNFEKFNDMISAEYLKRVKKNKSIIQFSSFCKDLKSLLQYIARQKDRTTLFYKSNILTEIVKNFVTLKEEGRLINIDFIYSELLDVLYSYHGLWRNNGEEILDVLSKYVYNNKKFKDEFIKMIENSIKDDIIENNWTLFEEIKEWIQTNNNYANLKLKISNVIIINSFNHFEKVDSDKVIIKYKEIDYTEEGKEYIRDLFKSCLDMFLYNQNFTTFESIVSIMYKFNYLVEEALNYFYDNYININDIFKYELFNKVYHSYEITDFNQNYYKAIKKDSYFRIWKCLYYEEYELLSAEKPKSINNYVDRYVKEINKKNIEDSIRILKSYDYLEKSSKRINKKICVFLYKASKANKKAEELYKIFKNPYIYLALNQRGMTIEKIDDVKLLKALKIVYIESMFEKVSKKRKKGYEFNVTICEIIMQHDLYNKKKYKKVLLNKLSQFSKNNKPLLTNSFITKDFIKALTASEVEIVLNNYIYSLNEDNYNIANSEAIFNMYMKAPGKVRNFLEKLLSKKIKIEYVYNFFKLFDCPNYENERKNNINFCLKIIKKYGYLYSDSIVKLIIKPNDEKCIKILSDTLKKDTTQETLKAITILLNIIKFNPFDCFDIVKEIYNSSTDEEIRLDLKMFMTGPGIIRTISPSSETKDKIKNIRRIKNKENDEKIKKFLNECVDELKEDSNYIDYSMKTHELYNSRFL